MKSLCSIASAAVLFGVIGPNAMGQHGPKQKEQTHFSAEDQSVEQPVTIPAEVLALLAQDQEVGAALAGQNITAPTPPQSWFSAARVHLGAKGETDLIIAAEGPLVGANISPFWVFVHASNGYKMALFLSAHDLIVKRTRSHEYCDLESDGMTSSAITTVQFRFDGNVYKEYSEKTDDIK